MQHLILKGNAQFREGMKYGAGYLIFQIFQGFLRVECTARPVMKMPLVAGE